MCGACENGNFLLSYVKGDAVRCVEGTGKRARIGRVNEQCVIRGLSVTYLDGSRMWYSYDRWIEDWSVTGFSVELVDDTVCEVADDLVDELPEIGPPSKKSKPAVAIETGMSMMPADGELSCGKVGDIGMLAKVDVDTAFEIVD